MIFAMVCVFPVPGGPCTTTPGECSSIWMMRACSLLYGFRKKRSEALVRLELSLVDLCTLHRPRKLGNFLSVRFVTGSVTIAVSVDGNSKDSSTCFLSLSKSWIKRLLLRGLAKSTQVSVTLSALSALGKARSSGVV